MLSNFLVPLAALLTSTVVVMAADRAPSLDVTPSCRAAATMGGVGGRTVESCLQSEQNTHAELDKEWAQFTDADKKQCKEIVSAFEPTYTELATCLEMARDARTRHDRPQS
jgi:hypothetical protein